MTNLRLCLIHLPTAATFCFMMYRYGDMWSWVSGVVAHYLDIEGRTQEGTMCGVIKNSNSQDRWLYRSQHSALPVLCTSRDREFSIICELPGLKKPGKIQELVRLPSRALETQTPVHLTTCPQKHVTHEAFACDPFYCWGRLKPGLKRSTLTCDAPMELAPPYFECQTPGEFVAYSLMCDFRQDCTDGSDESFCTYPVCDGHSYQCNIGQV